VLQEFSPFSCHKKEMGTERLTHSHVTQVSNPTSSPQRVGGSRIPLVCWPFMLIPRLPRAGGFEGRFPSSLAQWLVQLSTDPHRPHGLGPCLSPPCPFTLSSSSTNNRSCVVHHSFCLHHSLILLPKGQPLCLFSGQSSLP
jgi:hypothetical protein